MNVNYSRDAIRELLEIVGHPLPRFDILQHLVWAAGTATVVAHPELDDLYDAKIVGKSWVFYDNLDTMRADGDLVLLRTPEWRRILGLRFNPQLRIHTQRGGSYWYATREQHERWLAEPDHPAQVLAQIQARLDPNGALPHVSVPRTDLAFLFKLAEEHTRLRPPSAAPSGPSQHSGMTADRISEIRSVAGSEFRDWEWADTVIDELLREVERLSPFSTGSS
ncbi:hypothetical protein ACFY1P_29230 [Streptomyces sp. NPDC001407]|uniref:hypothetical protein n=1 Tax=unclassified Streptomyces TaxID=2593676 RepID=UPI003684105D